MNLSHKSLQNKISNAFAVGILVKVWYVVVVGKLAENNLKSRSQMFVPFFSPWNLYADSSLACASAFAHTQKPQIRTFFGNFSL